MQRMIIGAALAVALVSPWQVSAARGCVSGAAVGGVAGHVAGHHAVLGAAAGCAINHHRDKVKDRRAAAAQQDNDGRRGDVRDAPRQDANGRGGDVR